MKPCPTDVADGGLTRHGDLIGTNAIHAANPIRHLTRNIVKRIWFYSAGGFHYRVNGGFETMKPSPTDVADGGLTRRECDTCRRPDTTPHP